MFIGSSVTVYRQLRHTAIPNPPPTPSHPPQIMFVLVALSLVLCGAALIYLLARGENFKHALSFTIVLLVASIPIAIEIVCTTTLALGSRQLSVHGAIVTRLQAIEEMAGMNMLCSDKTGTLTMNKMVIQVGGRRAGGGAQGSRRAWAGCGEPVRGQGRLVAHSWTDGGWAGGWVGCAATSSLPACSGSPVLPAIFLASERLTPARAPAATALQDHCPIFKTGENRETVLQAAALAAKWKEVRCAWGLPCPARARTFCSRSGQELLLPSLMWPLRAWPQYI